MVAAMGWRQEELVFHRHKVSVLQTALLEGGDKGCMPMGIHLTPSNCILKMVNMVGFMLRAHI